MEQAIQTRIRWRRILGGALLTYSVGALVLAFALSGPAHADDEPEAGCCICDCSGTDRATTSGLRDVGVCFDAPGQACQSLCDSAGGCAVAGFSDASCDNVAACNANRKMAPVASPIAAALVGFLLAGLGLLTLTERQD